MTPSQNGERRRVRCHRDEPESSPSHHPEGQRHRADHPHAEARRGSWPPCHRCEGGRAARRARPRRRVGQGADRRPPASIRPAVVQRACPVRRAAPASAPRVVSEHRAARQRPVLVAPRTAATLTWAYSPATGQFARRRRSHRRRSGPSVKGSHDIGLLIRSRQSRNINKSRICWEIEDQNRPKRVRKTLAGPETAGSPAGSPDHQRAGPAHGH